MTTEDIKVLENHFLAPIKQAYGTQGENGILEAYESSTGWKINDRNEQMYETPVHCTNGVLTIGTCKPSSRTYHSQIVTTTSTTSLSIS